MDEERVLWRRRGLFRGPFGDVELRWWRPRPRAYRASDIIKMPERAPAGEPVLAAPSETTWIEIQLVDEEGDPVPGAAYELTLPDGTVQAGKLNFRGRARVDDIEEPGSCTVTFPELDAEAWEKIG